MHIRDGTDLSSHYWCTCCFRTCFCCIMFGTHKRMCLVHVFKLSWLNNNEITLYNILRYYWLKYKDYYNYKYLEDRTDYCARLTFWFWKNWEQYDAKIVLDSLSLPWILLYQWVYRKRDCIFTVSLSCSRIVFVMCLPFVLVQWA